MATAGFAAQLKVWAAERDFMAVALREQLGLVRADADADAEPVGVDAAVDDVPHPTAPKSTTALVAGFRKWLLGLSPDERCALLLTAKADLVSRDDTSEAEAAKADSDVGDLLSVLVDVVCPELCAIDTLAASCGPLVDLLSLTLDNSDTAVNTPMFNAQTLVAAFTADAQQPTPESTAQSFVKPLMVARSCLLTQFFLNCVLISSNLLHCVAEEDQQAQ
eukprot:TRINITY_DN1334_c1_g1_i4.p1 TRINITY_DN1334_c1_g1~~TRINITY_DN1334_c1_g1_i4.p1  ORF type:complete len:244 (+),score=74.04 TRINITY_DN1334_c1_g1_i4:73-732(+)